MAFELPTGYHVVDGPPSVQDYRALRAESGLSPATEAQAEAGLGGGWAACHIIHDATGRPVGMGRVLGDGGWYFHVVDMAVLPDHQRRGLGAVILAQLLARIERDAPPGAYVTLLADAPGRRLYEHFGFVDAAPRSIGMAMRLR